MYNHNRKIVTYRPVQICKRRHTSRGAVFFQLAVSLPLIIIGLFIFIWVATFIHARVVLRDSLQIAIKQGAVLGKDTVSFRNSEIANDIASKIKLFRSGGNELLPLIGFRPDIPTFPVVTTYDEYLLMAPEGPYLKISGGIRAAPPEYLYSMVLVYEGIRSSLGTGNLKYPCSKDVFTTNPGCLTCVPIVRSQTSLGVSSFQARCLSRESLSIECKYHASFPILNTINKLFRILLNGGSTTIAPLVVERVEGYATNSNMLVGNPNEKLERLNCPNL